MLLAREEKSEKKKRFMILEARAFTFNFAVSLSYGKMAYLTKTRNRFHLMTSDATAQHTTKQSIQFQASRKYEPGWRMAP